jgi:hypothetical protein
LRARWPITNTYIDAYANAHPMHRKMCTDTEAARYAGSAAQSIATRRKSCNRNRR